MIPPAIRKRLSDDPDMKRLTRVCKVCNNKFELRFIRCSNGNIIPFPSKTCSIKCSIKNETESSKKHRKDRVARLKSKKIYRDCKMCGKVVESTAYSVAKFCRNNKCQHEYYSKNRTGKKNPAYRNGLSMKDKHAKTYGGNHYRACSNYRKVFLEKNQYLFCEVCKVNQNGAKRFEVHHIYYASRYPKHKELHNHKNLIMLCISCHNNFHSGVYKDKFKELEKERGLKKLFEKRLCNISSK